MYYRQYRQDYARQLEDGADLALKILPPRPKDPKLSAKLAASGGMERLTIAAFSMSDA